MKVFSVFYSLLSIFNYVGLNDLFLYYENSRLLIFDLNDEVHKEVFINDLIDIDDYKFVSTFNKNIYLVQSSGGLVYKLIDNKFIRIDKSNENKNTFNSDIFVYNNIIYKYGGYGNFDVQKQIQFFDLNNNEWDVIDIENQYIPDGCFSFQSFIHDNKYFVFNGIGLNDYNPKNSFLNDNLKMFNFSNKSWEYLGKTTGNYELIIQIDVNEIILRNHKSTFLLNIPNNSLSEIVVDEKVLDDIKNKRIKYINNKLYKLDIDKLELNEFDLTFKIKNQPSIIFYRKPLNKYLLMILTIIIIIMFIIINKNPNKLNQNGNYLYFEKRYIKLNQKEIQIINLLIRNDGNVENNLLYDLLENKNLDRTQNSRNKNLLIEKLNMKLKFLFGEKNEKVLFFKKNKYDRRMLTLKMNKLILQIFNNLKIIQ